MTAESALQPGASGDVLDADAVSRSSPCGRLKKRFGGLLALSDVSFVESPTGEIFGVIGPNGAGKTTLFSCLVGACAPTSGVDSVPRRARSTGLPNYAVVARGLVRTHQIVRARFAT